MVGLSSSYLDFGVFLGVFEKFHICFWSIFNFFCFTLVKFLILFFHKKFFKCMRQIMKNG